MADKADQRGWQFSDAAMLARLSPYTFWKPSGQLVALLKPGDHVKLIFELTSPEDGVPSGERMWVQIIEHNQNEFVGRLDNEPRYIRDLPLGSMISFTARTS